MAADTNSPHTTKATFSSALAIIRVAKDFQQVPVAGKRG